MELNTFENELVSLRKRLHNTAELSGEEANTAQIIIDFAKHFKIDEIITEIGGHGLAVVFNGQEAGKTIMIRCDMDAIPFQSGHSRSQKKAAHLCGHDGHMAIVTGLIPLFSAQRPQKGKVVLLYQPAEETGEGAIKIINDDKFKQLQPDVVLALHNLPGFQLNEIIVKENEFASASKGLIIRLKGISSHAAEPEKGITPALAVASLIQKLSALPKMKNLSEFTLVTIVHAVIGERAFGTSPAYAELMATFRAFKDVDMKRITAKAIDDISEIATINKLGFEIEWVEAFPATKNDTECVHLIKESAQHNYLSVKTIEQPFRWSEDFGHFTQHFKGALYGIGSGINQADLHHPDYEFPDEIIMNGTKLFHTIITKLLS